MYLVRNKVKKKIKELGFRSTDGFIGQLEMVVDTILTRCGEYTKPQKTMDRESLMTYIGRHNIK